MLIVIGITPLNSLKLPHTLVHIQEQDNYTKECCLFRREPGPPNWSWKPVPLSLITHKGIDTESIKMLLDVTHVNQWVLAHSALQYRCPNGQT